MTEEKVLAILIISMAFTLCFVSKSCENQITYCLSIGKCADGNGRCLTCESIK